MTRCGPAMHDAGVITAIESESVPVPTCWCCGGRFDEDQLTRLGSHPEVGVCAGCAQFLHRRAREQDGRVHPSAGAEFRSGVAAARGWVVRHDWHNRALIGRLLRRLDRRLP